MGVAAAVSVVLGLLVSRQVTVPVLSLRDAALAVAEGEYGRRVESQPGGGELTELTHAFNFMSRKLQLDRELIATKNAEIEAFNRELQDRVDERTRQLRDAQEQLIRSARLAAVGEMGAGLAHELNNPVAGILGLAQVLAARGGAEAAMLRSIEEQARRCAEIVSRMQRFSRLEADRGPVDRHGWAVVDLALVIEEVLGLVQASYRDRGVELARDLGPGLLVRGDTAALRQALDQVLQTMRAAAGPGARLFVHGHGDEDHVLVDFSLGGAPLRVGQDDWMAAGMAFWAARQAFAAHGGLLEEPTLPPQGPISEARWRLRLPRA
ncbi:HAMP domain-containing protein [Myxococcota bacterium]|nr:HAMP domain-containing protein [Myxococcota bacterium]